MAIASITPAETSEHLIYTILPLVANRENSHLGKIPTVQSITLIEPAIVILIQVLISFLLLILYGFIRYSKGVRYKLWAIGWMVYSTTAVISLMIGGDDLGIADGISTSGMLLGSILLLDGANEHYRKGRSLLIYIVVAIIGFAIVPIGLVFNTPYSTVFTIIGVPSALACWYSAKQFRKDIVKKNIDFWTAYIGFILWGVSSLLFIPFELMNLINFQVLILSTGILAAGAGLFSHFTKITTENLSAQYQISQLLESILSHDVRNYVGSLSESINQAIASEPDRKMWLDLALEIVDNLTDFVMEMRYLTSTVTRVESEKIPMKLSGILEDVSTRVAREYGFKSERIAFELDENELIHSCAIVKELFWNIFDNAFKHGTENLTVRAFRNSKEDVIVEIQDRAGGIPIQIQEFLNNPDALSNLPAPGIGLGIILIRGLALLCNIPMNIQDVVEDEQVVGSLFLLHFKPQKGVAINE